MNLWEARCGDLRLGWDSPVKEVVHPYHINLSEREGLGWLEGFAEWINRCGLASNGAAGEDRVRSNTGSIIPVKLSLHGKISYIPARKVEVVVDPGERPVISVRGVVDETMMYGTQLRLITEIHHAMYKTRDSWSDSRGSDSLQRLISSPCTSPSCHQRSLRAFSA